MKEMTPLHLLSLHDVHENIFRALSRAHRQHFVNQSRGAYARATPN